MPQSSFIYIPISASAIASATAKMIAMTRASSSISIPNWSKIGIISPLYLHTIQFLILICTHDRFTSIMINHSTIFISEHNISSQYPDVVVWVYMSHLASCEDDGGGNSE